ncbi:Egl nine 3 [Blyttiomyces sp. JEL0837]|nr:Egl nine 3 [Blyttiomyces sp. JEL0837]
MTSSAPPPSSTPSLGSLPSQLQLRILQYTLNKPNVTTNKDNKRNQQVVLQDHVAVQCANDNVNNDKNENPHNIDSIPDGNQQLDSSVIINHLATVGYCYFDNFLGVDLLEGLQQACKDMVESDQVRPAAMGQGISRQVDRTYRGDLTTVIMNAEMQSSPSQYPHFASFKRKLDGIVDSLDQGLDLTLTNDKGFDKSCGLYSKGVQIGFYNKHGARYVKHRDCSPAIPDRRITMILYLNEEWTKENGGELRLYPTNNMELSSIDIAPLSNRLLIFCSELEHEVLPSYSDRYALTMWFYYPAPISFVPKPLKSVTISNSSLLSNAPLTTSDQQKQQVREQEGDTTSTIFVSIAAYRDPETNATINSILSNATSPERIRVGVLYQDHPVEDIKLHSDTPILDRFQSRVETLVMASMDAKGPYFARWMIARKLFSGTEEYFLQVDSHVRFVEGWDCKLLGLLKHVKDPKRAVVSFYPPGFGDGGNMDESRNDKDTSKSGVQVPLPPYGPVIMRLKGSELDKDGMPRVVGELTFPPPSVDDAKWDDGVVEPVELIRQQFCAAGFVFGSREMVDIVFPRVGSVEDAGKLFDGKGLPFMATLPGLFFGEEALMSVRLFTHGFDIWVPRDSEFAVAFHRWDRGYRRTWYVDRVDGQNKVEEGKGGDIGDWKIERKKSQAFVRAVLGIKSKGDESEGGKENVQISDEDLAKYANLGREQSLQEFLEFSGISLLV